MRLYMRTYLVIVLLVVLFIPSAAAGANKVNVGDSSAKRSKITQRQGHSSLIYMPRTVTRVSVANDKVADVTMINPKQCYLNALAVGSTNVIFWDSKDRIVKIFDLRVIRDLRNLKKRLYEVMPLEPIEVRNLNDSVVLSGRVSTLEAKKNAEILANMFAPKKVANLLKVSGNQQVLLKVRFAEVSRKVTKRWNINLGAFNPFTGDFLFLMLDPLFSFKELLLPSEETATGIHRHYFGAEFDVSSASRGAFGFKSGDTRFMGFLDILKENGLARILAEPSMVAESGKKASFLAGGEYPIPVAQRSDAITIEFKPFGVKLNFVPEVLEGGRIKLSVSPEVSELDFSTAVVVQGFTVPGLRTRKANTQIKLEQGQSFAIAGLFRDELTDVNAKLPWLGDVPILGSLFRSTEFKSNKTELVIVVTPHLVQKDLQAPKTYPGKNICEGNDFEAYFLGKGTHEGPIPCKGKELESDYGHDVVF